MTYDQDSKFNKKVLQLAVHKPLTYFLFINNPPEHRSVQGFKKDQVSYRNNRHCELLRLQ